MRRKGDRFLDGFVKAADTGGVASMRSRNNLACIENSCGRMRFRRAYHRDALDSGAAAIQFIR